MRSMEITDEWLYQHMPVVDNAMITALENQVDREYVFSKRFEQKMQKVIRREAHPVLTGAQQLLKRMAIFFTGIVCPLPQKSRAGVSQYFRRLCTMSAAAGAGF